MAKTVPQHAQCRPMLRSGHVMLVCCAIVALGYPLRATADEGIEFFEKKIRPVLVQHCYKCHSEQADKVQGGFKLDSRASLRRGGESGVAIVPGQSEQSLLYQALRHDGSASNMPPSGKLPDAVIADFRQWIARGAPDPRDQPSSAALSWEQVLAGRRAWWSLQPVSKPSVPAVRDASFSPQPIDRFLQARWEAEGVTPAPLADRRALIRRTTLIVTGLPPTPAEVEAFVRDESPQAYEQLVDRLLASPRYGEHWARHWLDLVRYKETHGSEHDPLLPHAWKYRDYVIRALNQDVPYDRFVHEHLAGDRLSPRWNHELGINESLLGTMFYRFVEFYPTPVDVKNEEATIVESQIDAFGKTFQALTLACARCHDHKFDAVSAHDYYALYGIFASARPTMHRLDDPRGLHEHDEALRQRLPDIQRAVINVWRDDIARWPARLTAAVERLRSGTLSEKLEPTASESERDAHQLRLALKQPHHALYPLAKLVDVKPSQPERVAEPAREANAFTNRERYKIFAAFDGHEPTAWHTLGDNYPTIEHGALVVNPVGPSAITAVVPRGRYSHLLSDKHGGTFRSPSFTIDMQHISALVTGTNNARLRLIVENFQGDGVLFERVMPKLNGGALQWVTLRPREQWQGRRAYLEVIPRDEMTYPSKIADASTLPADGRSGVGIRYVVFHDHPQPPEAERVYTDRAVTFPSTVAGAAEHLQHDARESLEDWSQGQLDDAQAYLLDGLLRAGFFSNTPSAEQPLARLLAEYRAIEAKIPVPQRATGVIDEEGHDEHHYPRGDHRNLGDLVARRYLSVFDSPRYETELSGRLELAQELTSPRNTLTARVMVNRLWQHTFGEGLVRSVDNFGQLGELPSHPELLDYLAATFVEQGWSIKRQLRALLVSRAFRSSSAASPSAKERDPDNRLGSHFQPRRIEAESIRDSLLFVSGRLNTTMYGLGVPLHLNEAVKDFDRPVSGPLDGQGRRSIYLEARCNYPHGLLQAFDQPRPLLTVGRRDTTNVPAQSLALLNDPFVRDLAARFAQRVLGASLGSREHRIVEMYQHALGRAPSAAEQRRAVEFLDEQARLYRSTQGDQPADEMLPWQDLAHALFNLKAFIYLH